jgi:hypothetical protein
MKESTEKSTGAWDKGDGIDNDNQENVDHRNAGGQHKGIKAT